MKLYEIGEAYRTFLEAVENGDIPEDAIADTLEGLEGELDQKADGIASMVKSLRADVEAIKAEADVLWERMKAKEAKAERMKDYLARVMRESGRMKIETARNVLSFRRSTALYIADEEDFKQRHMDLCRVEQKVTIPRAELTKLIKSGREVPGAELRENLNLQIK